MLSRAKTLTKTASGVSEECFMGFTFSRSLSAP
uniref:Uncharacterized protein n=1 Tax=Rhizophora mucronata TaxID=61149 RepID=A0A2P2Q2W9_RHIMU